MKTRRIAKIWDGEHYGIMYIWKILPTVEKYEIVYYVHWLLSRAQWTQISDTMKMQWFLSIGLVTELLGHSKTPEGERGEGHTLSEEVKFLQLLLVQIHPEEEQFPVDELELQQALNGERRQWPADACIV